MKTSVKIGIGLFIVALMIIVYFVKRERYEEPPPPQVNPELDALKAEIAACGNDKRCLQKAYIKTVKKNLTYNNGVTP